jgi:hypothetical protein
MTERKRVLHIVRRTSLNSKVLGATLLILWALILPPVIWGQAGIEKGDGSLGVLKILSIRKITEEEAPRLVKDFLGATHVVRLRFDAPRDKHVYLYATFCGGPDGYVLMRKAGEIWWVTIPKASKSPGFKKQEIKEAACWLRMEARSSIEWEIVTQSLAPIEEARSVFVKSREKDDPVELISPWYTVSEDSKPPDATR